MAQALLCYNRFYFFVVDSVATVFVCSESKLILFCVDLMTDTFMNRSHVSHLVQYFATTNHIKVLKIKCVNLEPSFGINLMLFHGGKEIFLLIPPPAYKLNLSSNQKRTHPVQFCDC